MRPLFTLTCTLALVVACGGLNRSVQSGPSKRGPTAAVVAAPGAPKKATICPVCPPRGEPDDAALARQYKDSCDAGHRIGCSKLAEAYRGGQGVEENLARAAKLFQEGCDNGYAEDCFNAGSLYEWGVGVRQDGARAVQLFTRACDSGGAYGCLALGNMYRDGVGGGVREVTRATTLYARYDKLIRDAAASRSKDDDQICEHNGRDIGHLYYCGGEYTLAADTFKHDCESGDPDACACLGLMYEHGKGVPQDHAHAAQLYERGCECDDFWACGKLLPDVAGHTASGQVVTSSTVAGLVEAAPSGSACNPPPPPPCSTITLSRSGCYGSCPAYDITISAEGLVTFVGGLYVREHGRHVKSISKADTERLFARIECSDFRRWNTRYDQLITDVPDVTVTVRRGLRSRTIVDRPPCHTARITLGGSVLPWHNEAPPTPPGLCDIENAIDTAAGSAALIACFNDAGAKYCDP